MKSYKDLYQDTWQATDDAGRALPTGIKGKRPDGKVGIFYFMWHTGHGELMDHSLAYAVGGIEEFEKVMSSGPLGFAHYWAEPYFGYYRSDDEWVIRRHAYMLADAGIDFIFFDVTNGLIYRPVCETILKVWDEIRKEGYKTPDIMFITGDGINNATRSFNQIWDAFYRDRRYEELWFLHEGKPLLLVPEAVVNNMTDEQKDFFTFRRSWANTNDGWYSCNDGKGAWPWADMYPQKPGRSPMGDVEQAIVMCGFWVNGSYGTNAGRSFHNGKQPPNKRERDYGFSLVDDTSPLGLAYQEQFDRAIDDITPPTVMITGWNEWWAGRWDNYLPGGINPAEGQTIANTYIVDSTHPQRRNYFVDNLNGEYSRDIEPVKGLYNDNYYYQTVMNIRRFKGARQPDKAFGQISIDVHKDPSQWEGVGPEYLDYKGDTTCRDAVSYVGDFHYVNESGRNDLVLMKVSSDKEYLYFYAECASDITPAEGENWMNLFIKNGKHPGWKGYSHIIGRHRKDGLVSVEALAPDFSGSTVALAEYSVQGKVLQLKLERSAIGIATGEAFEFKWADNSVSDGDIMKFYDMGDTAPNFRFNYLFIE